MKLRFCEFEIDHWADLYTECQGEKYRRVDFLSDRWVVERATWCYEVCCMMFSRCQSNACWDG